MYGKSDIAFYLSHWRESSASGTHSAHIQTYFIVLTEMWWTNGKCSFFTTIHFSVYSFQRKGKLFILLNISEVKKTNTDSISNMSKSQKLSVNTRKSLWKYASCHGIHLSLAFYIHDAYHRQCLNKFFFLRVWPTIRRIHINNHLAVQCEYEEKYENAAIEVLVTNISNVKYREHLNEWSAKERTRVLGDLKSSVNIPFTWSMNWPTPNSF